MIGRDRQRPPRAHLGAALLVGLGALALGAGCTKPGDGLILVKLTSSEPLTRARVVVVHPTTQKVLGTAEADWPMMPPLQLGVYIPNAVSGPVDVIGCGFDGMTLVASTPNDQESFVASAKSGATSEIVTIALAPGSSPAHCMAMGAGGRGGSGPGAGGSAGGSTGGSTSTGGNAGTGGSAGGTSGTGGAGVAGTGGGTGGSAGAAGRGGTTGTGGIAGSGGGTGGGAGSAGGTGGVAGSGGRGGTGGGAGSAGRGGTGGTGGSVGGTSGTGGAAGKWGTAVVIPTVAGQQQRNPSVAVDAAGNAVVIYVQNGQIWANHYDRTAGWGTPGAVDSRGMVQSKPEIAVDKDGHYLAVWGLQTGSTLQGIWYSTSNDGITWLPQPQMITNTVAVFPVLAMNPNGAALVAWSEQTSGGLYQAVGAARPTPGTNWELKVLQIAEYGDREPAVAMSGNGYGFVGWTQTDGLANGWYSVWMTQYTVGVGWSQTPDTLEKYILHNAYGVSIAANAGGDAIATYVQVSDTNPRTIQLWSRRFSPTTSWVTALQIFDAPSIDTTVPASVTLDDAGNATVAFAVETTAGSFQVQTSRTARAATAWPAPTSLDTDDIAKADDPNSTIADATLPIVRSDPAGNVTLVWRKRTTASGLRFDLVSKRYAGGAWSPAVTAPAISLEDNITKSVFWPTLAVGAGGTAVTTWYFADTLDVWANVWR